MKGYAVSAVFLIVAISILSGYVQSSDLEDNEVLPFPSKVSRSEVVWEPLTNSSYSTYLNSSHDLRMEMDAVNSTLDVTSTYFDPYLDHNASIRNAIDSAPQWLNWSLSWKFHKLTSFYSHRYIDLLTNDSIDSRYLDELAYIIAYLNSDYLNSYWTVPEMLLKNVEMIYQVSSDVSYATVVDNINPDGQHSTLIYNTPNGNVTLPEEIYYEYLVVPRNEMEQAVLINSTDFGKEIDPAKGVFWREFLYTANDTGYPVLKDLLLNETTLWNGTRNLFGNGAVGAVTHWESSVMQFMFVDGMRRDHQPVSLYKQHFGLCGENAEVLAAAAKTALIPCVEIINFDMMHAWNEFYENGWHQWEGYSRMIDAPEVEGSPGTITVNTVFNPDNTFTSNTEIYTTVSNLTVKVVDKNGVPVDGAMVKIRSQPSTNYYGILPVLGNATDVNGEVHFKVGSNFGYFVQVLSPIDGWLNENAELPLAFPFAAPGQNHSFNVTLDTTMPLKANLSKMETKNAYGIRFNVTADDIIQQTKFYRDPRGYFYDIVKGYPDLTRANIYFLDDDEMGNYIQGREFFPSAVLNLSKGETRSVVLPDEGKWHIIVPGMSQPLTSSFFDIKVEVFRSIVTPEVIISSPARGDYLVGEKILFNGSLVPTLPYMGELQYEWFLNFDEEPISEEKTFSKVLPWGVHTILLRIFNNTEVLGADIVTIHIIHPNRAPEAIFTGLAPGSELEFGTRIVLDGSGSFDLDNDTLEFVWKEDLTGELLSEEPVLNRYFIEGEHLVSLNVSDGMGAYDSESISFTILSPNRAPIPMISRPELWDTFYEEDTVQISANGTYDLEEDLLSFRWESSIDGNVSYEKFDDIIFSIGSHVLTLFVDDGNLTARTSIRIHVLEKVVEPDREPMAYIHSPQNGESFFINDRITLSAQGSFDPDGTKIEFNWFVNGILVAETEITNITLPEGVHQIVLKVFSEGMNTTGSITIIVIDRFPLISVRINGTEVLEMEEIIFFGSENMTFDGSGSYDPDGTTLTFNWSIDDTVISTSSRFTSSFSPNVSYLKLVVKDDTGRTASRTVLLRILARTSPVEEESDEPEKEKEGIPMMYIIIPLAIIIISILAIIWIFSRRGETAYGIEE